jgi:cytochrome c peroxidase
MNISMAFRATITIAIGAAIVACGGDSPTSSVADPVTPTTPSNPATNVEPVAVVLPNAVQAATVGVPFRYDASRGHTVFSDPRRTGLTYVITFGGTSTGLMAVGGDIAGTPVVSGLQTVTITARDATGSTASHAFTIVVFGADLVAPTLPTASFAYRDGSAPLPRHFVNNPPTAGADNTPAANAITDAGATLGRVLFYDRRLSINDRVSCSSCHVQSVAFSDTARLSRGFAGGLTGRHSMGLVNARWYQPGRFFWDERAASLEAQVLQPLQDVTEMGMTLGGVVSKVQAAAFYAPLFSAAFGTNEITTDRMARALAQFVRSLVSGGSKFDQAFGGGNVPNFATVFTAEEQLGQTLFAGRAGCDRCHGTNAHVSDQVHNTGLDASITDAGAGNGRFKAPSLRNIEVRAPYMHDGRFRSLEAVVDFYNNGIQNNPGLDPRLRGPGGQPQRLNLSTPEKAALVAFLKTLTDRTFLSNPKFASPFAR